METRIALRSLARRIVDLSDESADLDRLIASLVGELAPGLLVLPGVGTQNAGELLVTAGELLVTAGENPERLRSAAGFAMLCGTCPIPASSGKTEHHRLSRGDRQANSVLRMIVVYRYASMAGNRRH